MKLWNNHVQPFFGQLQKPPAEKNLPVTFGFHRGEHSGVFTEGATIRGTITSPQTSMDPSNFEG